MIKRVTQLEEESLNKEVELRLQKNKKIYSDEEVRGNEKANSIPEIDPDDGWE